MSSAAKTNIVYLPHHQTYSYRSGQGLSTVVGTLQVMTTDTFANQMTDIVSTELEKVGRLHTSR